MAAEVLPDQDNLRSEVVKTLREMFPTTRRLGIPPSEVLPCHVYDFERRFDRNCIPSLTQASGPHMVRTEESSILVTPNPEDVRNLLVNQSDIDSFSDFSELLPLFLDPVRDLSLNIQQIINNLRCIDTSQETIQQLITHFECGVAWINSLLETVPHPLIEQKLEETNFVDNLLSILPANVQYFIGKRYELGQTSRLFMHDEESRFVDAREHLTKRLFKNQQRLMEIGNWIQLLSGELVLIPVATDFYTSSFAEHVDEMSSISILLWNNLNQYIAESGPGLEHNYSEMELWELVVQLVPYLDPYFLAISQEFNEEDSSIIDGNNFVNLCTESIISHLPHRSSSGTSLQFVRNIFKDCILKLESSVTPIQLSKINSIRDREALITAISSITLLPESAGIVGSPTRNLEHETYLEENEFEGIASYTHPLKQIFLCISVINSSNSSEGLKSCCKKLLRQTLSASPEYLTLYATLKLADFSLRLDSVSSNIEKLRICDEISREIQTLRGINIRSSDVNFNPERDSYNITLFDTTISTLRDLEYSYRFPMLFSLVHHELQQRDQSWPMARYSASIAEFNSTMLVQYILAESSHKHTSIVRGPNGVITVLSSSDYENDEDLRNDLNSFTGRQLTNEELRYYSHIYYGHQIPVDPYGAAQSPAKHGINPFQIGYLVDLSDTSLPFPEPGNGFIVGSIKSASKYLIRLQENQLLIDAFQQRGLSLNLAGLESALQGEDETLKKLVEDELHTLVTTRPDANRARLFLDEDDFTTLMNKLQNLNSRGVIITDQFVLRCVYRDGEEPNMTHTSILNLNDAKRMYDEACDRDSLDETALLYRGVHLYFQVTTMDGQRINFELLVSENSHRRENLCSEPIYSRTEDNVGAIVRSFSDDDSILFRQ